MGLEERLRKGREGFGRVESFEVGNCGGNWEGMGRRRAVDAAFQALGIDTYTMNTRIMRLLRLLGCST